ESVTSEGPRPVDLDSSDASCRSGVDVRVAVLDDVRRPGADRGALDSDRLGGHPAAAVDGVRVGGETRPQHDTVVLRITGGDAEGERVAAAGRGGVRGRSVPGPGAEQYGGTARTTQAEEATA